MLRRTILLISLICGSLFSYAQTPNTVEPCATMKVYEESLKKPGAETIEQFERWLAQKIQEGKANVNQNQRTIITIPYVVHVIHNGEPLGTASNIPPAWVQGQIDALNRDLRKANADIANLPTAFQSLAADFEIELCLRWFPDQVGFRKSPHSPDGPKYGNL